MTVEAPNTSLMRNKDMHIRQGLVAFLFFISFWIFLGAAGQGRAEEWGLVLGKEHPELIGTIAKYTIQDDQQTLIDLARHYDLGYHEITNANPDVDPWYPGAGTEITLPTAWIVPQSVYSINGTSGRSFIIQTGSFNLLTGAQGQFRALRDHLPAELVDTLRIEKIDTYYAVRIGFFEKKAAAVLAKKTIHTLAPEALVLEAGISEERLVAVVDKTPKKDAETAPVFSGIVINLGEMRLYYSEQRQGKSFVHTFPVGTGRPGSSTRPGWYRIIAKAKNPPWLVPASIQAERPELPAVVLPGPDNPLGEYALRLSRFDYLIHGTNKPPGIGRRVSNGCIRMYPEDIEKLYALTQVGCGVLITYETVKVGIRDEIAHIEVHPDYLKKSNQLEEAVALLKQKNLFQQTELPRLRQALQEKKGIPVPLHSR
ncbi:MAG: L,D-transpeptidase [Deltaproteobacteria bacterium]|jgi:lipoprotein-anchoring transpeptidase ErfK/SrfK|nr:L,D-transpeptidase [Deltaproteobacteria bacterium]